MSETGTMHTPASGTFNSEVAEMAELAVMLVMLSVTFAPSAVHVVPKTLLADVVKMDACLAETMASESVGWSNDVVEPKTMGGGQSVSVVYVAAVSPGFADAVSDVHVVPSLEKFATHTHAETATDPVGLHSFNPHETHFDVAAFPQCAAGHVVCVYVVHAEFATALYGTDVSQMHSVKPAFTQKVYDDAVHVNVSPAARSMLPGGVVP